MQAGSWGKARGNREGSLQGCGLEVSSAALEICACYEMAKRLKLVVLNASRCEDVIVSSSATEAGCWGSCAHS